jgi:hypothetical protein
MLNDSITSPGTLLEDLAEEEEHSPTTDAVFKKPPGKEESALREKKVELNVNVKTQIVDPEGKRFTTKDKGKGKADPLPLTTTTKNRATGVVEKENQVKAKGTRTMSSSSSRSVSPGLSSNAKMKVSNVPTNSKKAVKPVAKAASATFSGGTRVGMKLPPGKGGARRVPIDSAEAAPVGPGWRG